MMDQNVYRTCGNSYCRIGVPREGSEDLFIVRCHFCEVYLCSLCINREKDKILCPYCGETLKRGEPA